MTNLDKRLAELKKDYQSLEIPERLNSVVEQAVFKARKKAGHHHLLWQLPVTTLAAALILLMIGINANPTFAKDLSKVPVIGKWVRVITFKDYQSETGPQKAQIQVPKIEHLQNKKLEDSLNRKYLDADKKLYLQFKKETKAMKQHGEGNGHLGVSSGYKVLRNDSQILSISRYVANTVGSSSTRISYDTIDKKRQILITLPSLFRNDRYLAIINKNIIQQMRAEMKKDPSKVFLIGKKSKRQPFDGFETISRKQSFYITKQNKLVIVFQKYAVAPGYMGQVAFVIPTKLLDPVLTSHDYIR